MSQHKHAHHVLDTLYAHTRMPVIAAPMFLVSGPDLVIAACRAGVLGAFPAPNARTIDELERWMHQIDTVVGSGRSKPYAHWALNMIVHRTYDRLDAELELVKRFRPTLVITALGGPQRVLDPVHEYGGYVFADVNSASYARKAIASGVDGLVLVASGAGGHTGSYSVIALVQEIRQFWDGPLVVGGAIATGRAVHAVQVLGADFAYMGTRFIATTESLVADGYREMMIESSMEDIVATKAVSGVMGNWMIKSLENAKYDLTKLDAPGKIDFSGDLTSGNKPWKNVWSAGQGVGATTRVQPVAALVDELVSDYRASITRTRGFDRWIDAA